MKIVSENRFSGKTYFYTIASRANPQHPFDLAVYGKFLFYSDWVLHSIVRVNKYTGEEMTWLRKNIPRPMSVIAVGDAVSDCPRFVLFLQGGPSALRPGLN